MEEGTRLTPRQKQFLGVVLQTPYILKRFYLTGGTALSYWYLHHRKSRDIDLFSQTEVNIFYIQRWFQKNKDKLGYRLITHSEQLGFHTFNLRFAVGEDLKAEFNYYPSERIEKGIVWKGLSIDSLYDIAVNKFQTIGQSPRGRDYVDLYLIVKLKNYSLHRLRQDAAAKFEIHTDTIHLARQFLRVREFKDLPKILVPFKRQEMEEFFLNLAKGLEKEIFKK